MFSLSCFVYEMNDERYCWMYSVRQQKTIRLETVAKGFVLIYDFKKNDKIATINYYILKSFLKHSWLFLFCFFLTFRWVWKRDGVSIPSTVTILNVFHSNGRFQASVLPHLHHVTLSCLTRWPVTKKQTSASNLASTVVMTARKSYYESC